MPKTKNPSTPEDVKLQDQEQEFQLPSELIPSTPDDVAVRHNHFLWEICYPFFTCAPSFGFQPYTDGENTDMVIDFANALGIPLQVEVEIKAPILFWAAREIAIAWFDAKKNVDQCNTCGKHRYLKRFKIQETEKDVKLCAKCEDRTEEKLIPWPPKPNHIQKGK